MFRIITLLLPLLFIFPLFSEEVGVVTFVQGKSFLKGPRAKSGGEPLKINQMIKKGDTITTADGICEIQLATQATIRLEKFSSLSIDEFLNPKTKETSIKMYSGKLFVKVHKQTNTSHKLNVVSPNFVAGVRGTEFIVALPDAGGENDDVTLPEGVYVNEGSVAVQNDKNGKEILVQTNEEIVLSGKELKKQILNDYAKEKMKILEHMNQMKEENYKLIKEQFLKNEALLNEMKGKKNQ